MSKKKIVFCYVLNFILILSAYLKQYTNYYAENKGNIDANKAMMTFVCYALLHFILAIIVCGILPFVVNFRNKHITKREKLEYQYGKKICVINIILGLVISIICYLIFGGSLVSFINVLLFYKCNMGLFVEDREIEHKGFL